jgi:hypothetical protein
MKLRTHFGNALYENWRSDAPELRAALEILRTAHRELNRIQGSIKAMSAIYSAAYHLRYPEVVA